MSLDRANLDFLRQCAEEQGVSESEMLNRLLATLRRRLTAGTIHPDIARISGLVPAEVDAEDLYRRHLARKHR